ncbi:hypothetical protein DXA98_06900 [Lachnospiraceae bacterium OF09-6]|nr:hypothetical protein DXA98_06900 [Lachnospiraceae bacterium OF09-6]
MMNKAKKLGIALAVITITGTAGTAIGVNTYNERMAGVQAEESTETETEPAPIVVLHLEQTLLQKQMRHLQIPVICRM